MDHYFVMKNQHRKYMQMALQEADKAGQAQEVPIGAVIVAPDGEVLAKAYNQSIYASDPSAHAEMAAIRAAGKKIQNYRLLNTTMYVTVEPCIMCMGAVIHARIARVVFGAADPKWGAGGSLYDFARDPRLNHHPEIIGGVREAACRELMLEFFRHKREQ